MSLCDPLVVVVEQQPLVVAVDVDSSTVIVIAEQGPAGPPGTGGSGGSSSVEAGTSIGEYKVIALDSQSMAVHADASVLSHGHTVAGIATESKTQGQTVVFRSSGPIENPLWNWTPGVVLLGLDGDLTQSLEPSSLFSCVMGWGDGTTLIIRIAQPIYLRN
jgi:hypothetical protein